MTPEQSIAALDRQIEKHGQPIKIYRGAGDVFYMPAFVRGYKPQEIAGLITAADRSVALSPTALGEFGLPRAGDRVEIGDDIGTVQPGVEPLHIGGTLVRVNLRVRVE